MMERPGPRSRGPEPTRPRCQGLEVAPQTKAMTAPVMAQACGNRPCRDLLTQDGDAADYRERTAALATGRPGRRRRAPTWRPTRATVRRWATRLAALAEAAVARLAPLRRARPLGASSRAPRLPGEGRCGCPGSPGVRRADVCRDSCCRPFVTRAIRFCAGSLRLGNRWRCGASPSPASASGRPPGRDQGKPVRWYQRPATPDLMIRFANRSGPAGGWRISTEADPWARVLPNFWCW